MARAGDLLQRRVRLAREPHGPRLQADAVEQPTQLGDGALMVRLVAVEGVAEDGDLVGLGVGERRPLLPLEQRRHRGVVALPEVGVVVAGVYGDDVHAGLLFEAAADRRHRLALQRDRRARVDQHDLRLAARLERGDLFLELLRAALDQILVDELRVAHAVVRVGHAVVVDEVVLRLDLAADSGVAHAERVGDRVRSEVDAEERRVRRGADHQIVELQAARGLAHASASVAWRPIESALGGIGTPLPAPSIASSCSTLPGVSTRASKRA
ncbi:MAG: hypothetical protein RIT45_2786 [Pseudomonadota bacterium]